jgi:hypothetical protein
MGVIDTKLAQAVTAIAKQDQKTAGLAKRAGIVIKRCPTCSAIISIRNPLLRLKAAVGPHCHQCQGTPPPPPASAVAPAPAPAPAPGAAAQTPPSSPAIPPAQQPPIGTH